MGADVDASTASIFREYLSQSLSLNDKPAAAHPDLAETSFRAGSRETASSILTIYSRELQQFPLIGEDRCALLGKERQVHQQVLKDGGVRFFKNEPNLPDDCIDPGLLDALKGYKAAAGELFLGNLQLVIPIAASLKRKLPDLPCMGLMDMVSVGNIGLQQACHVYDPEKGKFSAIASIRISLAINRESGRSGTTIRRSPRVVESGTRMRSIIRSMQESLGRLPSNEEVAAELELPVQKVERILAYSAFPVSLNTPVGEDGCEFGHFIPDSRAERPGEKFLSSSETEAAMEVYETLDGREKVILAMRFGLEGNKACTLEEVGREFGVTRERIRQLQDRALGKLRSRLIKKEAMAQGAS